MDNRTHSALDKKLHPYLHASPRDCNAKMPGHWLYVGVAAPGLCARSTVKETMVGIDYGSETCKLWRVWSSGRLYLTGYPTNHPCSEHQHQQRHQQQASNAAFKGLVERRKKPWVWVVVPTSIMDLHSDLRSTNFKMSGWLMKGSNFEFWYCCTWYL